MSKTKKHKITKRAGMINYPVGDFLIQVKNAAKVNQKTVTTATSGLIKSVADALAKLRYLDKVEEKDGKIMVSLAYQHKEPVLLDLKLVSKPGLRIYMRADEIEKLKGPSIYLISTPKGVMSSLAAVKNNVGGEVIVEVF